MLSRKQKSVTSSRPVHFFSCSVVAAAAAVITRIYSHSCLTDAFIGPVVLNHLTESPHYEPQEGSVSPHAAEFVILWISISQLVESGHPESYRGCGLLPIDTNRRKTNKHGGF